MDGQLLFPYFSEEPRTHAKPKFEKLTDGYAVTQEQFRRSPDRRLAFACFFALSLCGNETYASRRSDQS